MMKTWYDFIEFGETFYETAPFRVVTKMPIRKPASEVFAALENEALWRDWMPAIKEVDWTSPRPLEEGSTRTITTKAGRKIEERCLVWEPHSRMSFVVTRATIPHLLRAGADFVIAPAEDGCVLYWTLALQPRGFFAQLAYRIRPLVRWALRNTLRRFKKSVEAA